MAVALAANRSNLTAVVNFSPEKQLDHCEESIRLQMEHTSILLFCTYPKTNIYASLVITSRSGAGLLGYHRACEPRASNRGKCEGNLLHPIRIVFCLLFLYPRR